MAAPQSIDSVLTGSHDDGGLFKRAELFARAQDTVRRALPAPIAEHVHVGGYRQGELGLIADSAVYGSRLRLHAADLLVHLQQAGFAVNGLRIKVSPGFTSTHPLHHVRGKPLSDRAREILMELATSVDEDPALQASIENLANSGLPGYTPRIVPPPSPPVARTASRAAARTADGPPPKSCGSKRGRPVKKQGTQGNAPPRRARKRPGADTALVDEPAPDL